MGYAFALLLLAIVAAWWLVDWIDWILLSLATALLATDLAAYADGAYVNAWLGKSPSTDGCDLAAHANAIGNCSVLHHADTA